MNGICLHGEMKINGICFYYTSIIQLSAARHLGHFMAMAISILVFLNSLKVAPAELEALLCTHPSIQDAAVIGLKMDESVGEVPKAFVVLKPDTAVKPNEIEEFVEREFFYGFVYSSPFVYCLALFSPYNMHCQKKCHIVELEFTCDFIVL